MQPPARYALASFHNYKVLQAGQASALEEAKAFVEAIRAGRHWAARLRHRFGGGRRWKGLYLVGPVGTGKTHLLAAMYHALAPDLPVAFLHSSTLFRSPEHPETFARNLAAKYRVLCLDEIELDDAANEARLVLVLKTLERLGVTLLATSNVEPEKFLSNATGTDRFRRFLNEEFRATHRVIFVGGDDYRRRLSKPGRAWIGDPAHSEAALREAFDADIGHKRWIAFPELLAESMRTEHTRLLRRLTGFDSLYLAGIAIGSTDDALRLLRIVDDLYLAPNAPVLYFSADAEPSDWYDPTALRGLEQAIAHKFARTVSRLYALCEVVPVALHPAA